MPNKKSKKETESKEKKQQCLSISLKVPACHTLGEINRKQNKDRRIIIFII